MSASTPMRFCARQLIFRPSGARPQTEVMMTFIDPHQEVYGVEPICRVWPIAPSTYYRGKVLLAYSEHRCIRAKRDEHLKEEITRVELQ